MDISDPNAPKTPADLYCVVDQTTNVVVNVTEVYDPALLPAIPAKPFAPIEPVQPVLYPPAYPDEPVAPPEDASDDDIAAYKGAKAAYDQQMLIIAPVAEIYNAAIADFRGRQQRFGAALILYNVAMTNYAVALQQAMKYRYTPPEGTILVKTDVGRIGDIYNPADGSFTTPAPEVEPVVAPAPGVKVTGPLPT